MPMMPINYPNAGAAIPPTNRTYSKILKAAKVVNKTAHKPAILTMGGVMTVASTIYNVLCTMASPTIFTAMMKMLQMMHTESQAEFNAQLAILAKLI